ncbi:hypothetical protein ESOMN_v1c03690 [Williamsoniiplasma somnilux]|uniref:Uncharacterized protein n=1 Tax=Williamsoniiplasma somnilux TaxID=215578 RepID=A0A2K8P171_9MOLU|nr:hypothetical protein [Williamsoniiplasma somnilux]ATZ18751.1 hypothetical protein ESOMN_v1c03690 [Williamsoniiplasma somnilux]
MENIKKSKKELIEENRVLKDQIIEFNKILKDLEKEMRKKIWLWMLLPLFGFIIFAFLLQKRKDSEKYAPALLNVKTEIVKNELKIKINDTAINNLEN